jgi:2OG-Fe(II) oxygenase superfamily
MLHATAGTENKRLDLRNTWKVPDDQAAFSLLDESAIATAKLQHEPYDFAFVEQAIPLRFKDEVLADAPRIPDRGSYGLPSLRYGPRFRSVIGDLLSERFRHLMEQKFDIDLSTNPQVILMMGNTSGHYNEGHAHPDSKHKIITVILGFSREWPYERGRLRVLRSADREDCAFEFPPVFGRMLMFRVCDHSWHGFLPQKGPRMSLQLCFVDSEAYVHTEYWRHGVSAFAKSVPLLRNIIDWAPRFG